MTEPQSGYYVSLLDSKSREIPFSRIQCDDSMDAAECAAFIENRNPKARTLIGYIPTPSEIHVPHVCRGCNCQFDRRQLINESRPLV